MQLCTSLYEQISLFPSFPAAELHSFICAHCAALLYTILRAILFVTMYETQASACVTGDLGNQQGPVGEKAVVDVRAWRLEKKSSGWTLRSWEGGGTKMMGRARSSHNESQKCCKTSVPDVLLTWKKQLKPNIVGFSHLVFLFSDVVEFPNFAADTKMWHQSPCTLTSMWPFHLSHARTELPTWWSRCGSDTLSSGWQFILAGQVLALF